MDRQINHKTMRVIVGAIAIMLAPSVSFLANAPKPLDSISISYWTDARDIFVGSLIAVGFFLSAYNGSGESRDLEYYLSKAACVFAICVALFPTTGFDDTNKPSGWTSGVTAWFGVSPVHVHYLAAILLFACLVVMMWFFSFRAMRKGKQGRAYLYRAISVAMAAGMAVIGGLGYAFEWSNTILLVEIWGLTFFGAGWLLAGMYKTEPGLERVQ